METCFKQTRVYWKTREPLVAENSRGELFSVGVSIVQDSIKETNEPPLVLTTVICVKYTHDIFHLLPSQLHFQFAYSLRLFL